MNAYGVWEVSTIDYGEEVSGLGYYEGYLDFIALKLGTVNRHLLFTPIEINKMSESKTGLAYDVYVTMSMDDDNVDSDTYLKDMLCNRPVTIAPFTPYTVKIIRNLSKKESAQKHLVELLEHEVTHEIKDKILELIDDAYASE